MPRPVMSRGELASSQETAFARRVVSLALLAPSVHNTQPWRWCSRGRALELWADRDRALPALDPSGRQLVLSCGASLLHARLAVLTAGRECRVDLLPNPDQPDHLATLTPGAEADPAQTDLVLTAAMRQRHTARGPFEPRPVPADALQRLRRAAEQEGAVLHLVPHDDRVLLAVLLEHANRRQAANPAYAAELRAWVRSVVSPDGIPAAAAAEAGPDSRHTDVPLRDFGVPTTRRPVDVPPDDERPVLAVLLTEGDTRADWLAAGQGLARLLLTGAAEGIAASPLNQVVDEPSTRELLRRELRLLGYPQMVLRLGYGHGMGAPRREVADVLRVADDDDV